MNTKIFPENQMKIQISDLLYYVFLILMFFAKGIGLYDGQKIYSLIFWSAMLCAAGKIFLTEYTKKQWLCVMVLGIFAVIIERHSGEKGVLICYAVVIGMKNIPLKRIMQIGAVTFGVTMCGMVTYYGIFLEKSNYIEDVRLGIGETIRYSLGYPHPNNLLATYLATITMLVYCLGKKYNWKHALVLMAGNLYLYFYCMSYTGLITSSLMIVLPLYLFKIRKGKLGIVEYGIGVMALPICLLYSVFAPYIIPDNVMELIQQKVHTLYSRLMLSKMHVVPENIHLLGTRVEEVTTSTYSLDNSFLYTLVFCGVVFSAVMLVAYFYMMYYLIKEKRNLELIIACVFLLEGILEPLLFNSSFKNITLFLLGNIIWKSMRGSEENEKSIILKIPGKINEAALACNKVYDKERKKIFITSLYISGSFFVISLVYRNLSLRDEIWELETIRGSAAAALLAYIIVCTIISYIQYIKSIRGKQ